MNRYLPVLFILLTSPLLADDPTTITGKVLSVADGDTLTVLEGKTQHKIRLFGIDAPEKKQAFGTKAKDALAALTFGKTVTVTVVDTDRYGRSVGKVTQGGADVSRKMVADGFAWRYKTYDKKGEYTAAQAEAKDAKRGLWVDPEPTPPWEFRRKK